MLDETWVPNRPLEKVGTRKEKASKTRKVVTNYGRGEANERASTWGFQKGEKGFEKA